MDTMTSTKVVGALCGALLVYLLGGFFAEKLYHHDDHGHQAMVYPIFEDDHGAGEAVEEEAVPFAELLAAADTGKGERVFGKCKACHKLDDGANGTGPHLYALIDRAVGSVDGFNYSGALVAVAETWNVDDLNAFLEDPKGYAPGTKMSFAGLDKPEDRANLIAYLATIGG